VARLRALAKGFGLLWEGLKLGLLYLGQWLLQLLCGYGERPWRVLWSLLVFIIGFSLVYFFFGELEPHSLYHCLYYSLVSSVALGYGGWAPQPYGWAKMMGAVQSMIGIFLMALFVATFTRWMTR